MNGRLLEAHEVADRLAVPEHRGELPAASARLGVGVEPAAELGERAFRLLEDGQGRLTLGNREGDRGETELEAAGD